MMFRRALRKNIYLLLLTFVILSLATRFWVRQPLLDVLPSNGYVGTIEMLIPFILLLPISLIMHDPFEIELGLVCGVSTVKMVLHRFAALACCSAVSVILLTILFRYREFTLTGIDEIVIPIYVPENYRVYMAISLLVTVLFFASLFLFIRTVTRNCYAPVGLGILSYTIFHTHNYSIRTGSDVSFSLFDPFISSYFIGDRIPLEHYGIGYTWTYNRLLFFALSVMLLSATYFLLRREKLHEGFND